MNPSALRSGHKPGRPQPGIPSPDGHHVEGALRHVLDLLADGQLDMPVTELASLNDGRAAQEAL